MPSTVSTIQDWLTLLRQDSPVHHSRQQANDWEKLILETSFPKPYGSYGKWDPILSSWKMSEDWLMGLTRTLRKSLGNFPRRGTMRRGNCIPLPMPVLPTSDNDGGVSQTEEPMMFPTPSNQEPGWKHIRLVDRHGCEPPCHPNQRYYDKDTGRLVQKGLTQMASWPTPDSSARGPNARDLIAENGKSVVRRGSGQRRGINLETATKMWPTPKSTVRGDAPSERRRHTPDLPSAVKIEEELYKPKVEGSLNPDWVEWIMGTPIGWTPLDPLPKENYQTWLTLSKQGMWWANEPPIVRLIKGGKDRVQRLKALGNGIVPATLTGFICDKLEGIKYDSS